MQVIKDDMAMTYHMEGSVNGHSFKIEGEGRGKPYEGKQTLKLRVTKGGPLPFSFDILSAVFCYGNRAFTDYPKGIVDYFKPSFPDGYTWERTLQFEDGGSCIANVDISLDSKRNGFIHKSTFTGMNFPADGPVMQKRTTNWEPSVEKMTESEGILKGDVTMFLSLEDGKKHRCQFHTLYKAKKAVELPTESHYVEHRLVRADLTTGEVQLDEHAVARLNTV
ncbi:GFP-like fluorescent chromoprotein amFP486 [Porites lutea]|uniref:GFP-like fluorescent chromoprotein amFP486 n=1 Tax=Porites lutea TaxID=51062 RepID=UPI003CC5FE7A